MMKSDQMDLFPWIFAALLIAAAIPVGLALTGSARETHPHVALTASNPVGKVPPAEAPSPTVAAVAPMAATVPMAVAVPMAAVAPAEPPAPPTATIWQCVVNGQRTFSDAPCGAGASIRQLSEVNRMDAAPIESVRGYPPYSTYPALPGYPPPSDEDTQDGDSSYVTSQYILNNGRQRREHNARIHQHVQRAGGVHN